MTSPFMQPLPDRLLDKFGTPLPDLAPMQPAPQHEHHEAPQFAITPGNVALGLSVPLTHGALGFLAMGQPERAVMTGVIAYASFLIGAFRAFRCR